MSLHLTAFPELPEETARLMPKRIPKTAPSRQGEGEAPAEP